MTIRNRKRPAGQRASLLTDNGANGRTGIFLYCLSLLLHLSLLLVMFVMQSASSPRVLPPSIQVDIVTMDAAPEVRTDKSSTSTAEPEAEVDSKEPAPEVEPEPETRQPEPAREPEPEVVVDTSPEKKEVAVKPKVVPPPKPEPEPEPEPVRPEKKLSLKAKTYKPSKVLENARQEIAQNVEKAREETLSKALDRLKEQVKMSEKGAGSSSTPSGPESPLASIRTTGQKESRAIDLYNLELMYRIQQNWAFNERLARADKNLEVRILIKILKNGQLRDIWFETRSGNKYLDESALKAVKKSAPLPPLPSGYSSYDVGLIFTPSGLK